MGEQNLYQQLAEAVGAGDSRYIHRIFEVLTNASEARLLMAASPPATVGELSEKSGLSVADIEPLIDPLFKKGLLFKSKKPDATRYYRVRRLLQMHDSTAVALDASREMLDLWKRFMDEEFSHYHRQIEKVIPRPVMRVIPVNVTLTPETRILAPDDIRAIVANARNLAVTACSCRVIDGACGKLVEVCMQVDKAADYSIERGTGRAIDKTEALEILKQCETDGLVHVSDNARAPGHVICNCCSDCCMAWPSVRTGLGKFVSPSRFSAVVAADQCSGCESCLERCYFDAIQMTGADETAQVSAEKCMGCGLCLVTCQEEAITLTEVRPEEFIPA